MKPASPPGGRDDRAAQQPSASKKTPNSDMQAEDAGTAESSDAQDDDSGTAAARAMKQTSKTTAESGNKKR